MRRYCRLIWECVLRYSIVDCVTAVVIIALLAGVSSLICAVAQMNDAYVEYVRQSITVLALIYIASILFTSAWKHVELARSFGKNEVGTDTATESKPRESVGKESEAGTDKC